MSSATGEKQMGPGDACHYAVQDGSRKKVEGGTRHRDIPTEVTHTDVYTSSKDPMPFSAPALVERAKDAQPMVKRIRHAHM